MYRKSINSARKFIIDVSTDKAWIRFGACRIGVKSVIEYLSEGSQPKDFTDLEGKWVLEVEGNIVASSDRPDQILDLAEKYHGKDLIVFMVPYPGRSFY
jgi:hypothetical protein